MQLIQTLWYGRDPESPSTVAEAISVNLARELDPEGYANPHPIATFLGSLVEMLHENGVLSEEDVLKLATGWKKAD